MTSADPPDVGPGPLGEGTGRLREGEVLPAVRREVSFRTEDGRFSSESSPSPSTPHRWPPCFACTRCRRASEGHSTTRRGSDDVAAAINLLQREGLTRLWLLGRSCGATSRCGTAASRTSRARSCEPARVSPVAKGLILAPDRGVVAFTVPGMAGLIQRQPMP